MKSLKLFSALLITLTAVASAKAADQIDWWTFTGGGGAAQQNGVTLHGAIGPIAPALSPATGGNYTLTGGFWGGLSPVQLPDRPVLSIQLAEDQNVELSWPIGAAGFHLEYTDDLGSGVWHSEPAPVAFTEKDHIVTVPLTPGHRSYRLRWP